jgi:hypothetical protein
VSDGSYITNCILSTRQGDEGPLFEFGRYDDTSCIVRLDGYTIYPNERVVRDPGPLTRFVHRYEERLRVWLRLDLSWRRIKAVKP